MGARYLALCEMWDHPSEAQDPHTPPDTATVSLQQAKPRRCTTPQKRGILNNRETTIRKATFHHNPAAWWHLLSLDAPTVAALWSWFFASAMHLRMPLTQALMLGLATWLLYVADRILDGLGWHPDSRLHERHHFHARHRTAFLVAGAILTVLLVWSVFTRLRPEALHEDSIILLCALAYLAAVHRRGRKARWLPKELAVAIVFSAATAVPAWSLISTHANTFAAGTGTASSRRPLLHPALLDKLRGYRQMGEHPAPTSRARTQPLSGRACICGQS